MLFSTKDLHKICTNSQRQKRIFTPAPTARSTYFRKVLKNLLQVCNKNDKAVTILRASTVRNYQLN